MVLTSLLLLTALQADALAAPGQAGAVGVGITQRAATDSASRSHIMGWLRPADPVYFGVGVGHATTRATSRGLSLRLSGAVDYSLFDLGPFQVLIEGGGAATLGAANGQLVSTFGPTGRLVFLSNDDPISVAAGWAPELQPGTDPSFEAGASEIALRVWF